MVHIDDIEAVKNMLMAIMKDFNQEVLDEIKRQIQSLFRIKKNPAKVDAVMEVFNGFQLVTFAVDSGVSSQPKSDEETIRGGP